MKIFTKYLEMLTVLKMVKIRNNDFGIVIVLNSYFLN